MNSNTKSKSRPNGSRAPRRTQKMNKENLLEVIKKKKECNAKALLVIERLLEPVELSEFLIQIRDINQCHYQDIIEERAILKLCGYPICNKKLLDIPTKQYHISTIANKVYDLTDRKNFCSNTCFKAAQYVKEQMLTSPLWLRDQEVIPEFKVLNISS